MTVSTLRVIYGRRTKRVTLVRALVGLIAFSPQKVSRNHLLVLFDSMIWLQRKAQSDHDFATKFGIYLKVLSYILKHHRESDALTLKSVRTLSNSFLRNLSGFMIEKRNVNHVLARAMSRVEVRPGKQPGIEKRSLPPARYIGVGYRDKGTAKKPWIDGTPSWQEVASQPIGALKL